MKANRSGFDFAYGADVPPSKAAPVTRDAVAEIVNHGALHYTIGMRGYYLGVVFALWLFGPAWMLIGAVILVAVLYGLDRKA